MGSEFWRGKRVLVTGGCGFLGRHLSRELESCGALAVRNDIVAGAPVFGNLADYHKAAPEIFATAMPKVILHLAGMPGVAACGMYPHGAFQANVAATHSVLELASMRQVPVVCISSNHVYGSPGIFYDNDGDAIQVNEMHDLLGRGIYAATKAAADILAQAYGKTYGLPVGIARITNTYGPDDHHAEHIVTSAIKSVLKGEAPVIRGSGRDCKGFAYVKDTVSGILALAEAVATNRELAGEAFNIVPDEAPTVLEVVKAVCEVAGYSGPIEVQQPNAAFELEHLSNDKAKRVLGWSPQYSLQDGLRETVDWYREHA